MITVNHYFLFGLLYFLKAIYLNEILCTSMYKRNGLDSIKTVINQRIKGLIQFHPVNINAYLLNYEIIKFSI